MSNNTNAAPQLPVEVAEQIDTQAEEFANKYLNGKVNTHEFGLLEEAWGAGATEYATKLHQVEKERDELKRQNEKMKEQATGWRPLLEEVFKEDRVFGTISTTTIEKITKFLYGE